MIALIQRVSKSSVKIDNIEVAKINHGFNILLGVVKGDSKADIDKLVNKIVKLRVFSNSDGKFDYNIIQVNGKALVVSQFTLIANLKKGNRPDFTQAMEPQKAKELYEEFVKELSKHICVKTGKFGANMQVEIINDGPVTIIVDSKEL